MIKYFIQGHTTSKCKSWDSITFGVAREATPIDVDALGAVLDIRSGDNDDKAGKEGWESHM